MTSRVTMQDVAQYASVSVATVSRVLNEPESVALDTRQRVLDAFDALGYRLNSAARALRTQRTNAVALIVDELDVHTQPVISQIADDCFTRQIRLQLYLAHADATRREAILRRLYRRGIADGVIWMIETRLAEQFGQLQSVGIPVLLLADAAHDDLSLFWDVVRHTKAVLPAVRQRQPYLHLNPLK